MQSFYQRSWTFYSETSQNNSFYYVWHHIRRGSNKKKNQVVMICGNKWKTYTEITQMTRLSVVTVDEYGSGWPGMSSHKTILIQRTCCNGTNMTTLYSTKLQTPQVYYQQTKPQPVYSTRRNLPWKTSIGVKQVICTNNLINFSKTHTSPYFSIEYLTVYNTK